MTTFRSKFNSLVFCLLSLAGGTAAAEKVALCWQKTSPAFLAKKG